MLLRLHGGIRSPRPSVWRARFSALKGKVAYIKTADGFILRGFAVKFGEGTKTRLRQSVASFLLLLVGAYPLLENRLSPSDSVWQGPNAPFAKSFLPQTEFFVAPVSPPSEVKHERVWNSSFVHALSDVHLTRLPHQMVKEGCELTPAPVHLLLISIQSSSDR